MVLDSENDIKTFLLHAVRQKAIVTYFLKALGQYMLKETAYEFFVGYCDDFSFIRTVIFSPE